MPISAIVFGGRRKNVAPLVYEARSWKHGVLVGAGTASETTAGGTETTAAAMEMISVKGASMPNATGFPIWLAKDLGFLADNGLDLEIVYFQSGAPMVEAGVQGDAWQVGWIGSPPGMTAAEKWGLILAGMEIEEGRQRPGATHRVFHGTAAVDDEDDPLRVGLQSVEPRRVPLLPARVASRPLRGVVALDLETGKAVWEKPGIGAGFPSPLIHDNHVY